MDNNTFHAQCTDVAICINGLSLTLTEADGGVAVSKIMNDVHKLIKSFRLLGKHYVSELLKKCRELETKNQELETLSRKLQQVQRESIVGHSVVPGPSFHSNFRWEQWREMEAGADRFKCVSELSKGKGALFEPDKSLFQCLKTKSELVDRPREDPTFLEGVPHERSTKTGKEKEQMENLTAENGSLSRVLVKGHAAEHGSLARVLLKDRKDFQDCSRLGSNMKERLHFTSAKRPSSHSGRDHELPLLECARVDKGIIDWTENIFHASIQPVHKLVRKHTWSVQFSIAPQATLDNHPEDVAKVRMDKKGVPHLQVSEVVQQKLVLEQSVVESLCSLLENYQHSFFEESLRARGFKNVI